MKLCNTTEWPDYMLRRMVAWCCRQVKLPPSRLRRARFGKRSHGAYNGHGGGREILVRIGPANDYPVQPHRYPGRKTDAYMSPFMADRVEGLVAVTAHELTHCRQTVDRAERHAARRERLRREGHAAVPVKRQLHGERATMFEERRVLDLFRANREALLAEWNEQPVAKPRKPAPTRAERNEVKARAALAKWERKLKLARTKVSTYRAKVRRYDKIAARRAPA